MAFRFKERKVHKYLLNCSECEEKSLLYQLITSRIDTNEAHSKCAFITLDSKLFRRDTSMINLKEKSNIL